VTHAVTRLFIIPCSSAPHDTCFIDNPFHNFEHASTVLNNINKIVSLCKAPDDIEYHDIRFITTDPWTHFALVFTALIHDVDHAGTYDSVLYMLACHVPHLVCPQQVFQMRN
jgi:hypothetical protein